MRILAIDLGMARTGLAICDATEMLASPLETINQYYSEKLLQKVVDVVATQKPELIVVGHPRNMDGTCGESAKRAEDFAEKLEAATDIKTVLWDERMTTVTAIGYLNETNVRGKKRKSVVDTVAATIILQDYLNHRRLQREKDAEKAD